MSKQWKLLFVADPKLQSGLDKGKLTDDLKNEFARRKIVLAEGVTVSILEPGKKWSIIDKQNRSYVVEKAHVASKGSHGGVVMPPSRSGQEEQVQLRILGT